MDGEKLPLQEVHASNVNSGALSEENESKFRKYVLKGKQLTADGYVRDAVRIYKKALNICFSEKLTKRIAKMEAYLEEHKDSEEEDEEDDMIHVGNGFYLFKELYNRLYPHQKDGILWFWGLHKKRKGGILGDDMGLGKTIQVISFLSGMFDADKIKCVLIVVPVSVIPNWEREFELWAPGIKVENYHGGTKRDKERALNKILRRGGVLMTSYGMMVNPRNTKELTEYHGKEQVWDYVILDEGHKIKNPSNKSSKGIHSVPAKNRVIMTGTPIQNNLKELWALFDWTHQGSLLGTAKTFSMEYDNPISRARQKDATSGEQRLGQEMAASLKKIISPYFLRRTKAEVTTDDKENEGGEAEDECVQGGGTKIFCPRMPSFTRKNDLVVWVYLSEVQQGIYRDFSTSDEIAELLNTTRSPLTALVTLKKICDHPRLLTTRQCMKLGLTISDELDRLEDEDNLSDEIGKDCAANRIDHIDDDQLIKESGKMVFLVQLLDNLKAEGHRCLVFSQSRKVLDIIQRVLTNRGHKVMRLDGTVTHTYERQELIKKFQKDSSYSVFLLTTQVGGVGLTLTAADRVVIFDPSWNPATDAQAVDRAFRIGQDKNVVVYRLISCGSIEEKIYRRQIFKDSIFKQTTGNVNNPYRYFSRGELHELFTLDNPRVSTTQEQLAELHSNQRKTDTSLDEHLAFLHSLEMFGISDHDLMFSKEAKNTQDDGEMGNDYIQQRVQKAQQLLSLESESNVQMTQELGKYPAPEVFKEKKIGGPSRAPNWNFPYGSQTEGGIREPTAQELLDMEAGDGGDSDDTEDYDSAKEGQETSQLGVSMEELNLQDDETISNKPQETVHTSEYFPSKIMDDSVEVITPVEQVPEVICLDTPATEQQEATSSKVTSNTKKTNLFWQKFQERQKNIHVVETPDKNDESRNRSGSLELASDEEDDSDQTPLRRKTTPEKSQNVVHAQQEQYANRSGSILLSNDEDEEFEDAGNSWHQSTSEKSAMDYEDDEYVDHMSPSYRDRSPLKPQKSTPQRSPRRQLLENAKSPFRKLDMTPAGQGTSVMAICPAPQMLMITDSPAATGSPRITDSPSGTRSPMVTNDSPASRSPMVTANASVSRSPMVTDNASASRSPMVTDNASVSSSPMVTDSTPISPMVMDSTRQNQVNKSPLIQEKQAMLPSTPAMSKPSTETDNLSEKLTTCTNKENTPETPEKRHTPDRSKLRLSMKKRRSVCHNMTPARGMSSSSDQSPAPNVIKEDFIFSPQPDQPLVQSARQVLPSNSEDMTFSYADFEEQVNSRVNSTSLFDVHAKRAGLNPMDMLEEDGDVDEEAVPQPRHKIGQPVEDEEEGEEEEEEDTQTDNNEEDGSAEDAEEYEEEAGTEEEEEETEEEDEEEDGLSQEETEKYLSLVTQSQVHYKRGDYQEALDNILEALQIYSEDERAQAYALKIHKKLSRQ